MTTGWGADSLTGGRLLAGRRPYFSMDALVILVAAGRGERMGAGRPKAFLGLAGEPLLRKAAQVFEAAPSVGSIVAVVPPEEVPAARDLLAPLTTVM